METLIDPSLKFYYSRIPKTGMTVEGFHGHTGSTLTPGFIPRVFGGKKKPKEFVDSQESTNK